MTPTEKDPREGEGVRVCANESRPAAGADLTGPLRVRPQGKAAGPVAHAGTGGAFIDSWLRCIDCGKRMVIVPGDPALDDDGHSEPHIHECLNCDRRVTR